MELAKKPAPFLFLKNSPMAVQHFLTLKDLAPPDIIKIVERASELKRDEILSPTLSGRTLALLFDKSSTRTRVAFEVAMTKLGGSTLFLSRQDSQIGRGEPVEDSARVLSRMVDCIAIRTFEHQDVEKFAAYSSVPVINALTDSFHPCQLLADMQTYFEYRGSITGKTVAWIGDGNNMCQSYLNAATVFDFQLNIACPNGYQPDSHLVAENKSHVKVCDTPAEAVTGANLVVTDVWASMGKEHEQQHRIACFKPYQVNQELMSNAHPEALFMHCLPAHRGEEVTDEVLESEQSVIWDEAENRMHSQRALLEFLYLTSRSA
jgi:ornithine carbamoyltransferase